MKGKKTYLFLFFLIALLSCKKDEKTDEKKPVKPDYKTYIFKDMKDVFGFYGQNRYSYCPSLLKEEDGTVHMFFCGNPNQGIMVDNIYHIRINPDGFKTKAKSVLQPGAPGSWDDHHTCDPSVIAGEFKMDGQSYKYAMFFLTNKHGVYYNEIGVAFSNQIDGNEWIKYPEILIEKTWSGEGDQNLGNNNKSWGVGQPSAVSLDNKGKILLTYTIGDISGTRIVWEQIDLSNMNNYSPSFPTTMVSKGLININYSGEDYTCNSDFAVCTGEDAIVMIRPVQPHPADYPAYLNISLEVDYMKFSEFLTSSGTWTPIIRITPDDTKFPRNHNAGIESDEYGRIESLKELVIYFTVSKAAPEVNAATGKHAEWTYHIYKGTILEKLIQ